MSDKFARTLLAVVALGLSGCDIGDVYQRPATPTPAQWTDGEAGLTPPPAAWWQAFHAPGLDQLIDEATRNNQDLAAAMAKVRQADASVTITGGALLPALDFAGSGGRSQTPVIGSGGKTTGAEIGNTFKGAFEASYEIDFWGKNHAAVEAASANARGSRYDWQTVLLTTQASVATTYFAILGTREELRVARDNLANAEDTLSAIQDKMRFGTATDLDVAQQEAQVASARAAIPSLDQALRQNVNALALLLGRLPEETPVPAATLADVTAPVVGAGLPSALLQRRPDVASAEQQLVAGQASINQARAALFPSITLTGDLGFESGLLSNLLASHSLLWSLGAGVTQPIFHGGALEGGVELERGLWDQLLASYRKSILAAFQDAENALVAWRQSTLQEDADRRYVETARRAFDVSQDQLRGGTVDITTVLNTQKTLFDAETALASARMTRLQAAVSLYRALGGGWDGVLSTAPTHPPGE